MPGGFGGYETRLMLTPSEFTDHIAGYFFPQNTGVPTEAKQPSNYFWTVARTGVGAFKVTVLGTAGFVKPILAATQNPTPINIQVCQCIDPAGALQTVGLETIGGIAFKANSFSFTIQVFNSNTNVAADITQPGSPTLNGSFILWRVMYSELRSTRVPFKGGF